LLTACGSSAESAVCSALDNFNVTTLQAQVLGAINNELTPAEQDELKDSATQLRNTAAIADANLSSALNSAGLAIDDAAKKHPSVDSINTSFTQLGKEVDTACGSEN
jgi:hypothetical protein